MNKRFLAGYISGIIGALALGVLIGSLAGNPLAMSGTAMDKSKDMMSSYPLELTGMGMHTHNQREVPPGVQPPTIKMDVIPDPMKPRNYSLHLITENFRFAPEKACSPPVAGEGHGHLYIDDVLISRIYGPWQHIPALKPGRHIIYVTLNYNNHDEYLVNNNTVGVKTEIEVK